MMMQRQCTAPSSSGNRPQLQIHSLSACRHSRQAASRPVAATGKYGETATGAEANTILDAFFLGRAFAETVNERLGAALGDALSEISKLNAERDYAIKSFQQEVQQRADREKERRTGLSFGADPTAPTSTARQPAQFSSARTPIARRSQSPPNNIDSVAAPDVQAEVDELRAEVAAAKAAVQQLKAAQQQRVTRV